MLNKLKTPEEDKIRPLDNPHMLSPDLTLVMRTSHDFEMLLLWWPFKGSLALPRTSFTCKNMHRALAGAWPVPDITDAVTFNSVRQQRLAGKHPLLPFYCTLSSPDCKHIWSKPTPTDSLTLITCRLHLLRHVFVPSPAPVDSVWERCAPTAGTRAAGVTLRWGVNISS